MEDKDPSSEAAGAAPPESEVDVECRVGATVTRVISVAPPSLKARRPSGDVPPQVAPFRRPAWVPVVEEGDGGVADSKFAGTPWLAASEEWPRCPGCDEPIQFFLQLDLARLPGAAGGEYGAGLLQMFYCTNEESACDVGRQAWSPFSESVLARLVEPGGGQARADAAGPEVAFPPKRIAGWREVDDYPGWQEAEGLGVKMDDGEWESLFERGYPRAGDKLAGWPYWVQDVEYPDCPECGRRMRLVFQVDSDDNLPFCFGDVGCGHITQCPEHKDVLAFGWACT